jgi:uncharacterized protein (UPF0333 family)
MKMKKRGQITYEYLVVVGMILLLIIPFFNYAFFTLGSEIVVGSGVAEIAGLALSIDEIATLGQGSSNTLDVSNAKSVEISDGLVTGVLNNEKVISFTITTKIDEPIIFDDPEIVTVINQDEGVAVVETPTIVKVTIGPARTKIFGDRLAEETTIIIQNPTTYIEEPATYVSEQEVQIDTSVVPLGTHDVFAVVKGVFSNSIEITK